MTRRAKHRHSGIIEELGSARTVQPVGGPFSWSRLVGIGVPKMLSDSTSKKQNYDLTRRAKHWHSGIIEKFATPARDKIRRGFFRTQLSESDGGPRITATHSLETR
ncbi:hypothetical protein [Bradyrhizobium sp. WSM471]|uniref:hypothetical protein n=1 Tax=Bradyrhizobium sp. WSM471 TaxID=319017 RepID=UPI001E3B8387|nr:hypothetical protein [Bradyrhizobium canariense]UFW39843.1 hypothetical protein BcanWSM471_27010 [Bradyrhizobium canariense]